MPRHLTDVDGAIITEDIESRSVNVKQFGVVGDGIADDTTKLQDAINYCTTNKKELLLENKTYLIKAGGLSIPSSNLTIRGSKVGVTTIKASSMNLDSAFFTISSKQNIKFENIIFNGNSDPNVKHAIYCSGNNVDKNLRVVDCTFTNFIKANNQTIYAWQANDVWIKSNKFVDCVRPIFLDSPNNNVYVETNLITSPSLIMVTGIQCNAASEGIRSVYIAGNTIDGAKTDQAGNGIDGHGIRLYRTRGAKVIGNTVRNSATSGILIAASSWDSVVTGNVCYSNKTGIYVELNPNDTTLGADKVRGAIVSANTSYDNGQGICVSYSAGAMITSNIVHDNQGRGIVSDSEKVNISNNLVYNNYKDTSSPNPPQFTTKAGIESYGLNNIINGNICYDNQTVKTQLHGIAVQDKASIITGNMLKGNATGGIQYSEPTTNIVANNIV